MCRPDSKASAEYSRRPNTAQERSMSFKKLTEIMESKYIMLQDKGATYQRMVCKKPLWVNYDSEKSRVLKSRTCQRKQKENKGNGLMEQIM